VNASRLLADVETNPASSRWELSFGPVYRSGTQLSADWQGDAVAARIPFLIQGASSHPNVGPLDGYANRDYVDGFVYVDPGTTDPQTDTYGMTWNWGYDNSAQYQGNRVTFHSASVTDANAGSFFDLWAEEQQINQAGFNLSAGCRLWRRQHAALGFSAGLSWFPERSTEFLVVRRGAKTTWRYVDTYSAPYSPFPAAPYSGTQDGPGYLLRNIPASRDIEILSRQYSEWQAESTLRVDVAMMEARLGFNAWFMLSDLLVLRLAPQLLAAHIETLAASSTVIAPVQNGAIAFDDRVDGREWLLGWGGEAEARMPMGGGWYIGLAAASDWWSDEVEVTVDPFDAELSIGQWSYMLTAGRAF